MNLMKKFYCRCFQAVFRIALPVLPYRNPIIINSLGDIPGTLLENGKRHPILVTDGMIREIGLTGGIEDALNRAHMPYEIYDGTRPNPTTDMVEEAVRIYRSRGCDSIISIGGGSPMDCAKALGARIAMPKKSLSKMAGLLKVWRKIPLLIAVPTTAGTGSEATLAAVIVDGESRHKYVINDFHLIPRYAVLDPAMTRSMPYSVAAATGMDALTHAVEAYIGHTTTRRTRADAEEAVRLVFRYLERAAGHSDRKAEAAMLRAAHLAGRAFTRSYVGYVHAVSHSLGGEYDLPHGRTNATLLPIVLRLYGGCVRDKLARLAICAGLGKAGEGKGALAKRFLFAVQGLNDRLGIPRTIPEIKEADIPKLAAYADREANPLYPVPVLWDAGELEVIYRKAMGGKS